MSSSHARLNGVSGRIFKFIPCCVTIAADPPSTRGGDRSEIKSCYLGVDFHLERNEENMLHLNGAMAYYITDKIWSSLLDMAEVAPWIVFRKGYKEFWQGVASGGVMSLSEVLDCIILDNHVMIGLNNQFLLPVNLSVSEEKLLKVMNLVGLSLQTKKVYWPISLVLSFTAALLEFRTSLRVWLYAHINSAFCSIIRVVCDRLPLRTRRQVYSLGIWVENFKPSNDMELRFFRGNICAVLGGGAKVTKEGATLVPNPVQWGRNVDFYCRLIDEEIGCAFHEARGRALLWAPPIASFNVKCTPGEFEMLKTFVSCAARNGSGSLRCCTPNNVVRVRGFRESVIHYAKSGFPPVYELQLQDAVVK